MMGVTGAAGGLGSRVVRHLVRLGRGAETIGFVRRTEPQADSGVRIRRADYDDAKGMLEAFSGVDVLLLIASNAPDPARLDQHARAIEAAVHAGASRLIYTSLTGCDHRQTPVDATHRETERLLRSSGLSWTVLRNAEYTENWTAAIPDHLRAGTVPSSTGGRRFASATRDDLAEAAAVVMAGDGHDGAVYDLCGDDLWGLDDLASLLTELAGRPIRSVRLSEAEQRTHFAARGMPPHVVDLMTDVHRHIREGSFDRTSPQLAQLLGRAQEPWDDVVRRAVRRIGSRA